MPHRPKPPAMIVMPSNSTPSRAPSLCALIIPWLCACPQPYPSAAPTASLQTASTVWSMAPKIEWPRSSSISISTRSPRFRNSRLRRALRDGFDHSQFGDARIADTAFATGLPGPPSSPRLETVPEPMIVPAESGARLCGVGNEAGKSNVMSTRRARPNGSPLRSTESAAIEAVAVPHASWGQFVRRDGDRREGGGGLRLEEAEALAELIRDQVAQGDIVAEHDRRMDLCASSSPAPRRTSPVMTATSPSMSQPQATSPSGIGRAGRGSCRSRPDTSAGRSRTSQASRRRAPCARARRD
jgi:hypothetical protein